MRESWYYDGWLEYWLLDYVQSEDAACASSAGRVTSGTRAPPR
jgi:hypothetical protein